MMKIDIAMSRNAPASLPGTWERLKIALLIPRISAFSLILVTNAKIYARQTCPQP